MALSGPPFTLQKAARFGAVANARYSGSASVPLGAPGHRLAQDCIPMSRVQAGSERMATPQLVAPDSNLFANPQAVYSQFGYVQLSSGVDGYGHPLYGQKFWNVDTSFGKRIPVAEHKAFDLAFDFFNLFDHANFSNPGLSLTGSTAGFGVISSTAVPANRQASSRWIQASLRLEF